MSNKAEREFPDGEIEGSLDGDGGWLGWLGASPEWCLVALKWKTFQGDELPEELEELRDVLAGFGFAPIEQAVARVLGLEAAFAEISGLMGKPGAVPAMRIQEIVRTCVQFAGDFGTREEELEEYLAERLAARLPKKEDVVHDPKAEEDPDRVH